MDRYLLIDPTGINLAIFPTSVPNIEAGQITNSSRTITGNSITSANEYRYDFSCSAFLEEESYRDLKSLSLWQQSAGRETEIVIYYLFDRHEDFGIQTREAVPDLPITSRSPVNNDNPLISIIEYYPVLQGDIEVSGQLIGNQGQAYYDVGFRFIEGTIRRPV